MKPLLKPAAVAAALFCAIFIFPSFTPVSTPDECTALTQAAAGILDGPATGNVDSFLIYTPKDTDAEVIQWTVMGVSYEIFYQGPKSITVLPLSTGHMLVSAIDDAGRFYQKRVSISR